ncbi:uncharacterized protein WCC33_015540 [Rhinophrynus dorsalis]
MHCEPCCSVLEILAKPGQMRTFLRSKTTPKKKSNEFPRQLLAPILDYPKDTTAVTGMVDCVMGKGDAEEAPEIQAQGDGTSVQWGEFQGTWSPGQEMGNSTGNRGWQGCTSEANWVAFRDVDTEEMKEQTQTSPHNGRWWCEDSAVMCESATEHSIDKSSLQRVFEDCFPSITLPVVHEGDVRPLEAVFTDTGSGGESQMNTGSAEHLWGTVCDRRKRSQLWCTWEGSKLHSSYLSSLPINPKDKVPSHKAKPPASSPVHKEKVTPRRLSAVVGKEPELKFMKVASVSVHVSGFSPSHHLQSLFQHWTQPSKTRLRVAYDFNCSLLV